MRATLSLQADLLYPIFALAFSSLHVNNFNNAKQHSALYANRNKARYHLQQNKRWEFILPAGA